MFPRRALHIAGAVGACDHREHGRRQFEKRQLAVLANDGCCVVERLGQILILTMRCTPVWCNLPAFGVVNSVFATKDAVHQQLLPRQSLRDEGGCKALRVEPCAVRFRVSNCQLNNDYDVQGQRIGIGVIIISVVWGCKRHLDALRWVIGASQVACC